MDRYEYVIVGNGVAGATAAQTIRQLDVAAAIAIVSDEPHPLYSRVLLPNYVKGEASRDQVFLRKAEDYHSKNIEFIGGEMAVGLEAAGPAGAGRQLRLAGGRVLEFGKLLIATGGRPRPLNIPGQTLRGVARLQTIEDADRLREVLGTVRHAVVVGGSFIALEFLEILARRGIPTTLVMPQPYVFSRFLEPIASEMLQENFQRHDITIVASDQPAAIEGDGAVRSVRLASGQAINGDFVGMGIGLDRNTGWLSSSGVSLTPHGVATDEFLETSLPGVFSAGDVADFHDIVLGFRHTHGNWGNAVGQGQRAGRTMAAPAEREPYRSVTAYGIRNLGYHIAFVGHVGGGPGMQTVSRLDRAALSYGRFFLRADRLVGAALINRHADRPAINELISRAVPLTATSRAALAESAVDIASLVT